MNFLTSGGQTTERAVNWLRPRTAYTKVFVLCKVRLDLKCPESRLNSTEYVMMDTVGHKLPQPHTNSLAIYHAQYKGGGFPKIMEVFNRLQSGTD